MGLYQSTIHGTQFGQTIDVVQGWQCTGATNNADAGVCAQRVFDQWGTNIVQYLHPSYSISSCDAVGVDDPTVAGFFSGDYEGEALGDPSPAFVCGNVKLTTGVRGRSYQGRFGIPGLPEGYTDADNGNAWDPDLLLFMQGKVSAFISGVNTGVPSFDLVVISRISGGTPRPAPIATEVTVAALQAVLGSRISRKG